MLKTLASLGTLTKIKPRTIDNPIFKLHCRITFLVLIASSALVSTKQFFGEPIKCMHGAVKDNPADAINNYCWIHGVFTLKTTQQKNVVGKHVAYPGVSTHRNGDEEVHHRYYQWIFLILFVQAVLFYLPHYIWKAWEGGRIAALSADLDTHAYPEEKWTAKRKSLLLKYFSSLNGNAFYALRFTLCEILNLINVTVQFLILNNFLGGTSSIGYGPAIESLLYDPNSTNSTDPMVGIFPKVTKCTFHYYGSSGTLQNMDYICVLPLNVFNEKIFAILWIWFLVLAFISSTAVAYRLIMFMCPCIRGFSIVVQARTMPQYQVRSIIMKFGFGDWFMLYQLGKNLNPFVYQELLLELDREKEKKTAII